MEFHIQDVNGKRAVVAAVEDFTRKDDENMGGRSPGVSRREFFRYPLAASAIALLERAGFGRTRSGNQTLPVQEQSDLLIRNARVYTVEKDRPWAQAVAIKGDRIAWVGDDSDAIGRVSAKAKVIDARGRLVLPGFIDSHNHIDSGSDPDILSPGFSKFPQQSNLLHAMC